MFLLEIKMSCNRSRLIQKLSFVKMRWKLFIERYLTLAIACLIAGDLFLPQPYRSETQQLQDKIDRFFTSLLPRNMIIEPNKKKKANLL